MIDLAGTAKDHELKFEKEGICPNIQILYSEKQDPNKPVSEDFLKFFDDQVARAKKDGVGLLFRCTTGSHRTGRLAAYYQMKYKDMEPEQAIEDMNKCGVMMPVFENALVPQVYALHDYCQAQPCSQKNGYCVKK